MKYSCLNNKIIASDEVSFGIENRLFRYGDGFFETCIIEDGGIVNWNHHLKRIEKVFLTLDLPRLYLDIIEQNIKELYSKESFNVANIYFWREAEGIYTPTNIKGTSYLITGKNKTFSTSDINKIGVSNEIHNQYSKYAYFKSDSLKYVLAGIEMKKNNWEEILITDNGGNISELLHSNIFWKIDGVYNTPDLKTGCIEGVGRASFMDDLKAKNIDCQVGLWKTEVLNEADEIFSTNAAGRRVINWTKN